MSKKIIIIGLMLLSVSVFGQSQEQKDSLINEMCRTILEAKNLPDTARILISYEKHLYPFLAYYPEKDREEISLGIYYRFQRNCKEFKAILDRLDPPKGDWEIVTEKLATKLSTKTCKQFIKHKRYTYLETSGDTVLVQIENNIWIDHFKDGTYSKLSFAWTSDCEFDITFIESNNKTRKSFSKSGDKYRYQIIDKKPNYYDMSVEISGTNTFFAFKMYY